MFVALLLLVEAAARADIVRASFAQEDLVRKAVRAEGAQDRAEMQVECPSGTYDKTKGQLFIQRAFTSAKDSCLPCHTDPDGTRNYAPRRSWDAEQQWEPCAACELKALTSVDYTLAVPQCTACQHPAEVLLEDEEGRVRCWIRDSQAGGIAGSVTMGRNDLCSAAIQTGKLGKHLRPLQKAAIWDVSWDNGRTWETVPVHMNDFKVLRDQEFDPTRPERRLRTAVDSAAEHGFTAARFPDSPIHEGTHIVLLTFFPKYDNVRQEMLTLMAGASLAPGSRSLAFLLGPHDRLHHSAEAPGLLEIVSAHTHSGHGQRVIWKFPRDLLDLGLLGDSEGAVPSPLVRFSASNFKALGGCVEAMQENGGSPVEQEGMYAREALKAAFKIIDGHDGAFSEA